MEFVVNALPVLPTIKKNKFASHCALKPMKFTMVEIVFVPLTSSESMEFAVNVQPVLLSTAQPHLVSQSAKPTNHSMEQHVSVL
jgi:hypothetical protein